jgi:hypothetical protein
MQDVPGQLPRVLLNLAFQALKQGEGIRSGTCGLKVD